MHTIHNIAFDVDVDYGNELVSWEQYYVDFFQDKLLPKLETLCDAWEAKYPNTKCTIDTLDINVEIDNLNLEELQEKIISQIQDQLLTIDKNGKTTNGSVRATITSLVAPFDALISYLTNGILPAYITVKVFKEWLGNLIEFTTAEKRTLITLCISQSATIERILSLLRNDYGKFSEMLETSQVINTQYVKLEEVFFKKFLKTVCEKLQLKYSEDQAEIWFKTLGVNSSLAHFSKTFILLLRPKATAEQKRLININEQQLSIAVLQAIIQHDMRLPLDISISKICTVVANPNVETQAGKTATKETTKTTTTTKERTTATLNELKDEVRPEITSKRTTQSGSKTTTSLDKENIVHKEQNIENIHHVRSENNHVHTSETQNISSSKTEKNQNSSDQNHIAQISNDQNSQKSKDGLTDNEVNLQKSGKHEIIPESTKTVKSDQQSQDITQSDLHLEQIQKTAIKDEQIQKVTIEDKEIQNADIANKESQKVIIESNEIEENTTVNKETQKAAIRNNELQEGSTQNKETQKTSIEGKEIKKAVTKDEEAKETTKDNGENQKVVSEKNQKIDTKLGAELGVKKESKHAETPQHFKQTDQNTASNQEHNKRTNTTNNVDKTIIEKLAKLNATTREISLTSEKAGLILVHPFLGTFLNGAKLVTADNEISDIGKATMLLHYLTTGTEEVTDVELTLEKICLGIPLETIINYQTPLTEEDKALCNELLQAVLQHWKVLKSSTVNTLRDMFLKREGHITLKEDSIKLTIERFAQDILLDKIPWNISLFQLKWMDKMMHIEW